MENINSLINEYNNGNKEVFNKIFEMEEKQLRSLIKSFYHMEYEDLYQVACIGLLKAIKTYKSYSYIKFNSYMYNIVRNELLMSLRTYNKKSNIDTVKISIEENTTDELTIMDTIASDDNIEEEIIIKDEYQNLYNMINKCYSKNEMKKNVMYELLKDTKTQTEIAKEYNISRAYVSKIYLDFIKYGKSKMCA